jgi:hypothetical protein
LGDSSLSAVACETACDLVWLALSLKSQGPGLRGPGPEQASPQAGDVSLSAVFLCLWVKLSVCLCVTWFGDSSFSALCLCVLLGWMTQVSKLSSLSLCVRLCDCVWLSLDCVVLRVRVQDQDQDPASTS